MIASIATTHLLNKQTIDNLLKSNVVYTDMSKNLINNNSHSQRVNRECDFSVPIVKTKNVCSKTFGKKGSPKFNRLERLRRRMKIYRERSQSQGHIINLDRVNSTHASVGFNIYCKEQESRQEVVISEQELRSEVIFSFDESYLDSILNSLDSHVGQDDSSLCWMCGQFLPSKEELLQHASEQHFQEWLESNAQYQNNVNGALSATTIDCPKCTRTFNEMQSFKGHVNKEHEGLLTWLQFNGFDLS